METKIINKDYTYLINDLKQGKVVGFPTETVYGLGIVFDNPDSFNELVKIKQRDINKPISMMIPLNYNIENIAYLDDRSKKIISKFMPGAITVVLKAKENLPFHVTLGTGKVGIRIPTNKEALDILNQINKPLLVTSANISNQPSLTKAKDVITTFNGVVSSIVDIDAINGIASTVVDLTLDEIKILRQGPISLEEILEVVK